MTDIQFLVEATSRQAVGLTKPPIKCMSEAFSVRVKLSLCETDHSPPFSVIVKNFEVLPPCPYTSLWCFLDGGKFIFTWIKRENPKYPAYFCEISSITVTFIILMQLGNYVKKSVHNYTLLHMNNWNQASSCGETLLIACLQVETDYIIYSMCLDYCVLMSKTDCMWEKHFSSLLFSWTFKCTDIAWIKVHITKT